jgi:hypothetical protein
MNRPREILDRATAICLSLIAGGLLAWHLFGFWLWIPGGPLWTNYLRDGVTLVAAFWFSLGCEAGVRVLTSRQQSRGRVLAYGALLVAIVGLMQSLSHGVLERIDEASQLRDRIASVLLGYQR